MAQTVEELAEILDNIKLEADRNAETFDKLLTSINNKLEFMSNDTEADDLIKVYLTELKKTLEERHALVVSEFNKIEGSFTSLAEEQSKFAKTAEMKELFDTFSNNLQSIARELYNQKDILSLYDERFAAFTSDKTDKNEIITSVSSIRKDVEVINQNFEASISEINANIQSIFKNLIVMDPTAQNDIVKRELENVYLSTNAILSALHIVDQKNDDLAQSLENFITKENYEQSQEKLNTIIEKYDNIAGKLETLTEKNDLDRIIYQTSEISEKINQLPLRDDLTYFAEKATELSEQISGLPQRDDLNQITDNTVEKLQEKLDEISSKKDLENIISQNNTFVEKFDLLAEKSDVDNILKKAVDIEEKFNKIPTKNEIEQISGKTIAISEQISQLPQQNDLADIYNCVHEFLSILNTLREELTSSNDSANKMIREDLDKLNSVLSAVVTENDFTGFRHDLADFIQKIIDNSVNLNNNLNINKDVLQNLIKEIETLDIHKNLKTIANALDGLRISTSDNVNQINYKIDDISSKVNEIAAKDVEEKVNVLNQNLFDTTEDIKAMQTEAFGKLLQCNESIDKKISALGENFYDASENIKKMHSDVFEKLSNDDSENFKSLNNNIDFLRETILSSQNSGEASLTEKLLALRDIITTESSANNEKFAGLQEKLDEFIGKIQSISDDTEIKIGNSISEITDLKTEIEQLSKEFAEWNYGQDARDAKIVNMITSELEEIGVTINTLQDSIQAGVHQELTKNTEIVEIQINNLVKYIETLKENPQENTPVDLETPLKEIKERITAVKQEINLINTDINDVLNSNAETLMEILAPLKDNLDAFSNIEKNIDSKLEKNTEIQNNTISEAIQKLKENIIEILDNHLAKSDISDKLISSVNSLQETISEKLNFQLNIEDIEDIKNEISSSSDHITETINEKITSTTEDIKTLLAVAMNNDDLNWAIDDLKNDISDKVTRIFNERNNYGEILDKTNEISNEISTNSNKISGLLDVLNQKIDILAISDTNDDFSIQEEIDDIKEMISSQREILTSASNTDKINAIETHLEELINKINIIENTDLKDMREDIIHAVLNVFEQISFIEESEDIKDFVEEKTDEINQNLIEVKQQLKQLSNNDDGYSYTLQDVESDIAKLRLVINELSETSSREDMSDISENIHKIVTSVEDLQNSLTQEQISDLKTDFEKLSEDILSISSRTNKLLLTSDESYNALNNGLNDFSNIVYKLEERINYLDNKEITERIEEKLDNVANVVTGSANSDKVMRQALMYMGEWIDTTSENIESLCEQSNTLNEVKHIIEKLHDNSSEQTDLLNNLYEKFEDQQERMNRLEMKLEKILSVLDDIDDTKLTKKVDKIDKQITKLNNTIEKLASYVDE